MVERATQQRRAVSHRLVWIGLVVLAVIVLATFVIGYWVFVRYERRVLRHVPADTVVTLRLDVEQVVLYEPIRKHVFPALNGTSAQGDETTGRLRRFQELSGVNLGMDLREVALAVGPRGWVVLVGGLFPETGMVEAIERVVRETAPEIVCRRHELQLDCPPGLRIAQTSDGVLLLGSNPDLVSAALSTSTWAQDNGMTSDFAISFVGVGTGKLTGSAVAAAQSLVGATWLNQVNRVVGTVTLSEPLKVQIALEGLAASGVREVEQSLQQVQALAALSPGPDWAGERAMLARAHVVEANGRPVIRTEWTHDELDRAAATLGAWVARQTVPGKQ